MFVCTMEQCRSLVYWKALYFDSMPFTCLETVMASSFRQRQNTWFWPSKFEYSIFYHVWLNLFCHIIIRICIKTETLSANSFFEFWVVLNYFQLFESCLEPINTYFFWIFSTTELCFIIMILTLSHQGKKIGLFFYFDIECNHSVLLFIIGLIF